MNAIIERKPIRPTQVNFPNSVTEKQFYDYVHNNTKTNSVGMNRIREMVKKYNEEQR